MVFLCGLSICTEYMYTGSMVTAVILTKACRCMRPTLAPLYLVGWLRKWSSLLIADTGAVAASQVSSAEGLSPGPATCGREFDDIASALELHVPLDLCGAWTVLKAT